MMSNYEEFCYRCFNLLNGIVNPVNKSFALYINRASCSPIFGERNPYTNYITVYPYTVAYLYSHMNEDFIKTVILDTIVHELFHCDQILNIYKYSNDEIYRDNIEGQVVKKTSHFILDNASWLNKNLDVNIDSLYISNRIMIYDDITTLYRKTNMYNIYRDSLYYLTKSNMHTYIKELLQDCSSVFLTIDGNTIAIKIDNNFVEDLSTYNQFMYNNMYRYSPNCEYDIMLEKGSNTGTINIKFNSTPLLEVITY